MHAGGAALVLWTPPRLPIHCTELGVLQTCPLSSCSLNREAPARELMGWRDSVTV